MENPTIKQTHEIPTLIDASVSNAGTLYKISQLATQKFFIGFASSKDAAALLVDKHAGAYILRCSVTTVRAIAMAVKSSDTEAPILHFLLQHPIESNKFEIQDKKFDTLEEFIQYYSANPLKHGLHLKMQTENINFGYFPVFMSYSWKQKELVRKLHTDLAARLNINIWLDVGQMGGGDTYLENIAKNIRKTTIFVSCVSYDYTTSKNCCSELSFARETQRQIIPLLVGDISQCGGWPPEGVVGFTLTGMLYIDFTKDYDTSLNQLVHQISKQLEVEK